MGRKKKDQDIRVGRDSCAPYQVSLMYLGPCWGFLGLVEKKLLQKREQVEA